MKSQSASNGIEREFLHLAMFAAVLIWLFLASFGGSVMALVMATTTTGALLIGASRRRSGGETGTTRSRAHVWSRVYVPLLLTIATGMLAVGAGLLRANTHADFVWDALPDHEVDGVTYSWPGVMTRDFLIPPGEEWPLGVSPYTPTPFDTVEEAGARLERFLTDRFDLRPDPTHIRDLIGRGDGTPPPSTVEGTVTHPHSAGILAVERAYGGKAFAALARRVAIDALLILLGGGLLIPVLQTLQKSRIASFATGVVLVLVPLAVVLSYSNLDYHAYRHVVPIYRALGIHLRWLSAGIAVCVGALAWWSHRLATGVRRV